MEIIYTTVSGSTKRYAEMLAEKLGASAVELSAAQKNDEEKIYMAPVIMGSLNSYAEAKEALGEFKAVAAVGMFGEEQAIAGAKEKSGVTEPFFFLPGAFDKSKLTGMYRMMMTMALGMIKKKMIAENGEEGKKMVEALENGVDFVAEKNLDELLVFLGAKTAEEPEEEPEETAEEAGDVPAGE